MDLLPKWLIKLKAFQRFTHRLDRVTLSEEKVSLKAVSIIFLSQLNKDNIQEKAAAMAFNFTLAIFPAIIFLFTLIPYIPIPNLQANIMHFLHDLMPASIYEATEGTILEIISIQRGGLLSFGFLFAMYASTNGVVSMMVVFNKCYRTSETRGFIARFLIAGSLIFIITLTLMLGITLGIFSTLYLNYLDAVLSIDDRIWYDMIVLLKYGILLGMFWVVISLIYYIAPNIANRWRFLSLGSLVASIMGVVFTVGFSFYIENFNSYNKVYGSIGTFIGVLIWLFVISFVLLIGFEINASLDQAIREKKRKIRLAKERESDNRHFSI